MTTTRLNTVIVDGSHSDAETLKELLSHSGLVNVVKIFTSPKEFLDKVPELNMELCLLEVVLPELDGLAVAQMLNGRPLILMTSREDKLKSALDLSPIDVLFKPVIKNRLDSAIDKAYRLIHITREYAIFNVAENNRKIKIHLPDIMFVTTDEVDPRHKKAVLRNGMSYTLMNCSLEQLLELSPALIQVNRAELVSLEAVNEAEHDLVSLKGINDASGRPKEVTISHAFREEFHKKIFFK